MDLAGELGVSWSGIAGYILTPETMLKEPSTRLGISSW